MLVIPCFIIPAISRNLYYILLMDLSELDISIIEAIGDQNNHEEEEEVTEPEMSGIFSLDEKEEIEHEPAEIPNHVDPLSADESESEDSGPVQFMRLDPKRYNRSSFDIGTLIRFADLEKVKWYWGVVSAVGPGVVQGPFKLSITMWKRAI